MRTGIASFFFCKVSFMKHPNADAFKGDHIGVGGEVVHLYSGRSCLPALETSGALPPLHKVGLRRNTPVNLNHS